MIIYCDHRITEIHRISYCIMAHKYDYDLIRYEGLNITESRDFL